MKTNMRFYNIKLNSSKNGKYFRQKLYRISKHVLCSITLFPLFFENHAVYELMWENIVQPDRPKRTTWRTRIACCIPKATNTHSEYVILIAFPLQKRLYDLASLSRCTYIGCIVFKADVIEYYDVSGVTLTLWAWSWTFTV